MNARQIGEKLFAYATDRSFTQTCDTFKAGDPNTEVTKLAVTMFATPQVIRDAASWGAQMLLVHEPLYYNHWDAHSDDPIEQKKRALVEHSGMVVLRFHDHPHYSTQDMIVKGLLHAAQIGGEVAYSGFDLARIRTDAPITPKALAAHLETTLHLGHIRICGASETPCTQITAIAGAAGDLVLDELKRSDSEIVLAGEISEWSTAEYARDAAQLGAAKALLILGHVGSERDGMCETARVCAEILQDVQVKYFDCGEVYTYAN